MLVQMIQCGLSQNGIVAGAVYVQLNLPGHIQKKAGEVTQRKIEHCINLAGIALKTPRADEDRSLGATAFVWGAGRRTISI